MSDEQKEQRTSIYPYNVTKAEQLARSMNMSVTEMVNYLIESVEVQQMTKITVTDKKTSKNISILRRSTTYDPNTW